MRTIPYSDLLQKAAEATGRIYADLSVQDAGLFKGFFGTRLRQIWEKWPWPDLMLVEQRQFRPTWFGNANAAGEEYYFATNRKYYQALRASDATNPPAMGNPLVENSNFWAESATSYTADDWVSGKAYAVGAKVYYPAYQTFYQCHTTVGAGSGILPTDTTNWAALKPFDRYIGWDQSWINPTTPAPVGDVWGVFDRNPDLFPNAQELTWWETSRGIQVDTILPVVWLWHRKRSPFLKGNTFDAAKTYAVGEQIYFSQTSAAGNVTADFYDCLTATNAGESPASTPAKWSLVSIPFNFGEWLIHAAAADMLSKDAKDDWSADEMNLANEMLLHELDKEERQKGQEPPMKVALRARVC